MSNRTNIDAASKNILFVPLNRLMKSPKNVRKVPRTKADLQAFAASVAALGLLQYPVVEPELGPRGKPTGNYLVNAGEGRRLAQLLRVKRKEIKADEPIRCMTEASKQLARSQLQRLDSDLAELDHALAELQRQWSFGVHAAADARGFLAVEHDRKVAALGRNLHGAPLAAGLGHRVDLGVIDDGAGAVARVGARVEDVALVAGLGSGLLGVLAADEDAAVGIVADPELGVDLEVFVFFLRDQEGRGLGVLLVLGHDRAVIDREISVAVALPVIKVLAVEERDPAVAGLGLRRTGHRK